MALFVCFYKGPLSLRLLQKLMGLLKVVVWHFDLRRCVSFTTGRLIDQCVTPR